MIWELVDAQKKACDNCPSLLHFPVYCWLICSQVPRAGTVSHVHHCVLRVHLTDDFVTCICSG